MLPTREVIFHTKLKASQTRVFFTFFDYRIYACCSSISWVKQCTWHKKWQKANKMLTIWTIGLRQILCAWCIKLRLSLVRFFLFTSDYFFKYHCLFTAKHALFLACGLCVVLSWPYMAKLLQPPTFFSLTCVDRHPGGVISQHRDLTQWVLHQTVEIDPSDWKNSSRGMWQNTAAVSLKSLSL